MLRKMFEGGPSRKQGPRLAMRDADDEPPRDTPVRPCEWPSENFMDRAGIKEEFKAYLCNAGLEDFEADKCPQYHDLTSSFVRRFEYSSSRNCPSVIFDLYDKSYRMDLEDFTLACKLPSWGSVRDPPKSEFRNFLADITVGESRDITQATIGSIHFPAIHYFALFIGRCINAKDEACHMCVPDLSILRSAVLGHQLSVYYSRGTLVPRTCARTVVAPRGKACQVTAKILRGSFEPFKNKVFKPRHKAPARGACREGHPKEARPRQEELAGKAVRNTRPRQEELAGKANQGTTRDLLRRATRPGKAR